MKELFKDNIKKSIYEKQIDDLVEAIKTNNLENFLFGNTKKGIIKHSPNRSKCKGFEDNATIGEDAEKRICTCLFYKNINTASKNCNNCVLKDMYKLKTNEYSIVNYEVPAYYNGKGIGDIDFVISNGNNEYATEIKPHSKKNKGDNKETLLRMIAEILTYTYGFEQGKYKKAIAFFKDTAQYDEYNKQNSKIMEILELADISVFLFKETVKDKVEYEIIKLQ